MIRRGDCQPCKSVGGGGCDEHTVKRIAVIFGQFLPNRNVHLLTLWRHLVTGAGDGVTIAGR